MQKYCTSLVADEQRPTTRSYIEDVIPAFLGSIELWVRPGSGSASAGGADAESKSRPRRTGYHHHSANTRSSIDTAVPAVTLSGPDLGQEASILGNHTEHMPQQQQAEQGSSIPWGISSLNYSSESGKSEFLVRVFTESWANLTQKIM